MEKEITSMFVENFNGQRIDLIQEYKNKPLLLLFYNNQCLGCTGRAVPLAYEFSKEFKNIQVLGIHTSFRKELVTEVDVKSIFTIKKLPFPIYLDTNRVLYDTFEAEGTPFWVLMTKERRIYRSIFGSQPNAKNRLLYALESVGGNSET